MAYVPEGAQALEESKAESNLNKTEDDEELKDKLGDLELELGDLSSNEFGANEVCFICQNSAEEHDPFKQDSFRMG